MLDIAATEWRNNNRNANYPFSDAATLMSEQGVPLDRDVFDDARIYLVGASGRIFIPRINLTGSIVTIYVGSEDSGELGYARYDYNSPPEDLGVLDMFGRPAGIFVSDGRRLAALGTGFGRGDYDFRAEATEFAPSAVIALPDAGIWGILLDDGNVLSGEVWLIGENGVVLREEDGFVRVDVMGDPYAAAKECADLGRPFPVFCGIKTINGISPDANGDFKLLPGGNMSSGSILRISPNGPGRLKIRLLGVSGVKDG